jgi:VWFA-related protein
MATAAFLRLRHSSALLLFALLFVLQCAPQNSTPVLHTEAANVVIDVVVTGHDGAPVKGLSQANFAVRENGKPQTVQFFEAHTGRIEAQASEPLPPGTYANRTEAPPESSVDVLLLDALNTEMKDQIIVRRQMLKYLRGVPPGKHIAVFTLASELRLIKGFNTDSASLLAALESGKVGAPKVAPLLQTEADRNDQKKMEDTVLERSLAGTAGAIGSAVAELQHLQQFEADQQTFQTDLRVTYTLKALQDISRYLAGVPVRKNLIWLSASFPLIVLPDNELMNPNQNLRNYAIEVQRTARMLSAARVAVYPVDARGLFPPNSFGPAAAAGSSIRQLSQQLRDERLQFEQEAAVRQTMESVAQETGGVAIVNTNDLAGALREIDSSTEHYYTLAYTPKNLQAKGNARTIRIDVNGVSGSVRLQYRRSYVPGPPPAEANSHPSRSNMRGLLLAAMAHQAPQSTGLHFQVKVDGEGPTPDHGSILGENSGLKPPATRYRLTYQAEAGGIDLQDSAGGAMQGSVLILTVAYDSHGRVLNSQTSELALHFPTTAFSAFLKKGIQFAQELDVPPEAVSLRTGIFDVGSETIGSLELPLRSMPGQETKY